MRLEISKNNKKIKWNFTEQTKLNYRRRFANLVNVKNFQSFLDRVDPIKLYLRRLLFEFQPTKIRTNTRYDNKIEQIFINEPILGRSDEFLRCSKYKRVQSTDVQCLGTNRKYSKPIRRLFSVLTGKKFILKQIKMFSIQKSAILTSMVLSIKLTKTISFSRSVNGT